jgi:serine/threonine protein phosphatase PrpC
MGSGSSSAQTHTVDADAASSDAGSSASHAGPPVKVATKHGSGKLHKESMHKARGLESKGCHGTGSSCGTARVHLVAEKAMVQVQYAAQTRGVLGKDQDRYALHVPSGGKHGLALGIFDGHSVHGVEGGRQHAASAATQLPAALMRAVSKTAGSVGAASGPQTSHPSCASSQRALMGEDEPLVAAVAAEFSALQRGIEQRYRKQVTGRLMAAKAKLEAEIGEEMSLALPQEGGTTATAVVIRPKGIVAAWVGDSRAVLGLREPAPARGDGGVDCSGAVRALPLTNDHNLEDERERSRLLACGGKTGVGEMARTHVFVRGAEGTLRVRSDKDGQRTTISASHTHPHRAPIPSLPRTHSFIAPPTPTTRSSHARGRLPLTSACLQRAMKEPLQPASPPQPQVMSTPYAFPIALRPPPSHSSPHPTIAFHFATRPHSTPHSPPHPGLSHPPAPPSPSAQHRSPSPLRTGDTFHRRHSLPPGESGQFHPGRDLPPAQPQHVLSRHCLRR